MGYIVGNTYDALKGMQDDIYFRYDEAGLSILLPVDYLFTDHVVFEERFSIGVGIYQDLLFFAFLPEEYDLVWTAFYRGERKERIRILIPDSYGLNYNLVFFDGEGTVVNIRSGVMGHSCSVAVTSKILEYQMYGEQEKEAVLQKIDRIAKTESLENINKKVKYMNEL